MGNAMTFDSTTPARVGIIGLGAISAQYLGNLPRLAQLDLRAVADLDQARAASVADDLEGVRALTTDELLASDDIDAVINLTIPAAHAEIAERGIAAGKIVYGEKPLAMTFAEGTRVVEQAESAGLLLGCAPDTVLGTGIQTARDAIDSGLIGAPIAATATMVTPGHEAWHPNPDFYYKPGGGPLLDMGPYYITALVTMFGPVARVVGASSRSRDSRVIGKGARAGESVPVEIETHVTGVLIHESGVLSTLVMSFDAVASRASSIEVHGSAASLTVPDPNTFDGTVSLYRSRESGWQDLPVSAGYENSGRGFGLADLVGTPAGEEGRTSGRLALHVLEVSEALLESAQSGVARDVTTRPPRPRAVPLSPLP